MLNILWLAPNFNHYKARFLNHLALEEDVDLTIISGTGRDQMGDKELVEDWGFKLIKLNVSKKSFGNSKLVKAKLKSCFDKFDWILIPAEKKNIRLFLFARKLRKANPKVRLFSYNHAQLKSKNRLAGFLDYRLTKFFNTHLDRVVFYTEAACKQAVEQKLIAPHKAFWANNTIDNTEIDSYYSYQLPPENQLTILFIGRLIPSKRISDLIRYYHVLKNKHSNLNLEIIGDGPERTIVIDAIKDDNSIVWHGTLVDEENISPIMKRATLIFVPGLSGLSINHSFAYGRPYLTLKAAKHGPEISYLDEGENGYILSGNLEEDIANISGLLEDRALLSRFCDSAQQKGKYLSVKKWVQQFKSSLFHES